MRWQGLGKAESQLLLSCLGLKVATVSFALQLLGMGSQVWMDADLGGLGATVDAR